MIRVPAELEPLIPGFLAKRRAEVAEAGRSVEAGDMGALASYAHRLKGTGGGYGFDRLTELGRALEEQAKAGERAAAAQSVAAIAAYLERVEVVYVD